MRFPARAALLTSPNVAALGSTSEERYGLVGPLEDASMVGLGLVVARFDKTGEIIPEMEAAAREASTAEDATLVDVITVPGSYDTPLAADRLARRSEIDAVTVIGAIVTGATDHDQVIAHALTTKLTQVSLDRDTPVTLGVIGPGATHAEARQRIEYAERAVRSAVTMVKELEDTS